MSHNHNQQNGMNWGTLLGRAIREAAAPRIRTVVEVTKVTTVSGAVYTFRQVGDKTEFSRTYAGESEAWQPCQAPQPKLGKPLVVLGTDGTQLWKSTNVIRVLAQLEA